MLVGASEFASREISDIYSNVGFGLRSKIWKFVIIAFCRLPASKTVCWLAYLFRRA